jgi:hypothetical protein
MSASSEDDESGSFNSSTKESPPAADSVDGNSSHIGTINNGDGDDTKRVSADADEESGINNNITTQDLREATRKEKRKKHILYVLLVLLLIIVIAMAISLGVSAGKDNAAADDTSSQYNTASDGEGGNVEAMDTTGQQQDNTVIVEDSATIFDSDSTYITEQEVEDTTQQDYFAGSLVDIAAGNDDFSTLMSAVQAAGLVETLSSDGPLTVFGM